MTDGKIFVEKDEDVAQVIENILSSEGDEVTLVIPKKSVLGRSVSNFHLIKREAGAAGKKVFIESVDEVILALAKAGKLNATHPLFELRRRVGAFSDIVPREPVEKESVIKERMAAVRAKSMKGAEAHGEPLGAGEREEKFTGEKAGRRFEVVEPKPKRRRWLFRPKTVLIIVAVIVAVCAAFWSMTTVFGHATISLNFQKKPWLYSNSFSASTAVSKPDLANRVLPAEVFTLNKNLTQFFPATGQSNVSQKAIGRMTIFNAYSSAPQTLVAATRFETPDHKIFRLVNKITVPGAKINDGKITPASIDAPIAADKPGSDYNVGPVSHLTIPGFSGTPRYDGFYGAIASGTSGGYIGVKAVPTGADMASAKSKITDLVKASLATSFLSAYPQDFKILDGASSTAVTRINVNENTDQNGNFSVFAEGGFAAVGFRVDDLKQILSGYASRDNPGSVFDTLDLNYSQVKVDFVKGTESFYVSANGVLKPAFSPDDFKSEIAGKSVEEVRSVIAGLGSLGDAKISLWPVWLNYLPKNTDKIIVTVN